MGIRLFEWRQLYRPSRTFYQMPEEAGLSYDDVYFMTEDGLKLHGWWFPAERARATVIFCHGNAGNVSHRIWLAQDLVAQQMNVWIFDYRGYGKSEGLVGEMGTYRDARAAYEYLRQRHEKEGMELPIIVYGRSLGGAVALDLVFSVEPAGLVVDSTFISLRAMAAHLYPWMPLQYLLRYRYDNLAKIARTKVPLLIMHSREDELIPFHHAEDLYRAAGSDIKKLVETRGLHNESGWQTTPGAMAEFLSFVDLVQKHSAAVERDRP